MPFRHSRSCKPSIIATQPFHAIGCSCVLACAFHWMASMGEDVHTCAYTCTAMSVPLSLLSAACGWRKSVSNQDNATTSCLAARRFTSGECRARGPYFASCALR